VSIVVLIVFVAFAIAIAHTLATDSRRRERERFEAAAKAMDEIERRDGFGVSGFKDGRRVSVSWRKDGIGESTLVACELPDVKFALELLPQGRGRERQIRDGEAIDVQLGDEAFDSCWMVEGAPADIVRRVLDAPTRQRLTALGLNKLDQPSAHELRLCAPPGRPPEWIREAVALMAHISGAVDRAFADSDHEANVKAATAASPYRGEVRESDAPAARAAEMQQLHLAQNRRANAWAIKWFVVILGILVAAFIAAAYSR
jgi:hypothetical protein